MVGSVSKIINILPLSASDFSALHELYMHPSVNPQMDYDYMQFDEFIHHLKQWQKNNNYYIAFLQTHLIGAAYLRQGQFRQDHIMYLGGFAIQPSWQCQGYGKQLMQALIAKAFSNPEIKRIELSVDTKNSAALKLYQQAGFKIEGTLEKWCRESSNTYMNCHFMGLLRQENQK